MNWIDFVYMYDQIFGLLNYFRKRKIHEWTWEINAKK